VSHVQRQIVSESRSYCIKRKLSSDAEAGARPTDVKRTSVSRTQSSGVGVDDEAAVISQITV